MLKRTVETPERGIIYTLERDNSDRPDVLESFKFTVTMSSHENGSERVERAEVFAYIGQTDAQRILGLLAEGDVEPNSLQYVLDDCLVEMTYRQPNQRLMAAIQSARCL